MSGYRARLAAGLAFGTNVGLMFVAVYLPGINMFLSHFVAVTCTCYVAIYLHHEGGQW